MDRYAVIGNPVAHSLSPRIHALFAEQTGQSLRYDAILAPIDGFEPAIEQFRADDGKGLNVTLPFKHEAWVLAARRSVRAERAGAANTLIFGEDGIEADNTDGAGLLRDLAGNHGAKLAGRSMLILGAGGAVRGILAPLLEAKPAQVTLANRTVARAERLCRDFGDLGRLAACGYDELAGERFDLVIHATAAGVTGELPPLPDGVLMPGAWCYDLFYSNQPTTFIVWARAHGAAKAMDGLGMLVEQAAESFFVWRGVRPRTQPIIHALRPSGG